MANSTPCDTLRHTINKRIATIACAWKVKFPRDDNEIWTMFNRVRNVTVAVIVWM